MALVIKHTKVSTIPDCSDPSLVLPSDWNADHSLAGVADIAQGGTGLSTIGANGTVLQSNGTTASWGTPISGPATNLNGGSTGTVPYQSAPNTTAFTAAGSSGQVLSANAGAIPTWINQSAMTVGNATNATTATTLSATLPLSKGGTGQTANGNAGQALISDGAGASTWGTPGLASKAYDLMGGTANQILFQNALDSTHYIAPPTASGTVLGWNGTSFGKYISEVNQTRHGS